MGENNYKIVKLMKLLEEIIDLQLLFMLLFVCKKKHPNFKHIHSRSEELLYKLCFQFLFLINYKYAKININFIDCIRFVWIASCICKCVCNKYSMKWNRQSGVSTWTHTLSSIIKHNRYFQHDSGTYIFFLH